MNIKDLFRENIKNLAPYSTARDEYQGDLGVFLDANENPYENGYNRYPDPHQKQLKVRLAQLKGISADSIFIGNGSDEPIDLVYRVFCDPKVHNAVSIAPTYGMYKVAAGINDVEIREVQLEADFSLDAQKVLDATDVNTKLIFLCSPNNPTANTLDRTEIEKIIKNFSGIVVLDEAYVDFSEEDSFLKTLDKFKNLIVLQTLSKAWGMAGLRFGLAFADPVIIETLTRVKYPYNINVVTQKIVLDQLSDTKTVADQVAELITQRKKVCERLTSNKLVKKLYKSDANFVLIKVDEPRKIYDLLIVEGVIVRDRSRIKGCDGCLRISIGTPEENDKMLAILENNCNN